MNPNEMKGISLSHRQSHRVIEVDTHKVAWRGRAWSDLGSFLKRKFENLLVIRPPRCPSWCGLCLSDRSEPVKVFYI